LSRASGAGWIAPDLAANPALGLRETLETAEAFLKRPTKLVPSDSGRSRNGKRLCRLGSDRKQCLPQRREPTLVDMLTEVAADKCATGMAGKERVRSAHLSPRRSSGRVKSAYPAGCKGDRSLKSGDESRLPLVYAAAVRLTNTFSPARREI
jgi:hypothetical protein